MGCFLLFHGHSSNNAESSLTEAAPPSSAAPSVVTTQAPPTSPGRAQPAAPRHHVAPKPHVTGAPHHAASAPAIHRPPVVLNRLPLREGQSGPDVKALQGKLAAIGCNVVPDGVFGEQTRAAVILFENNTGLDAYPLGTYDWIARNALQKAYQERNVNCGAPATAVQRAWQPPTECGPWASGYVTNCTPAPKPSHPGL